MKQRMLFVSKEYLLSSTVKNKSSEELCYTMKGVIVSDAISHTIHIGYGTKHVLIFWNTELLYHVLLYRSFISLFQCYEIFVSMVIDLSNYTLYLYTGGLKTCSISKKCAGTGLKACFQ